MNHLFIVIHNGNDRIFVEPWSRNPELYLIEDNWTNAYDPTYNIFGEADMWMSEVNKSKAAALLR
ncbi:MAG: hypothetical protein K6G00_11795 [Treponema sp.]|nr:hypothetical protein [Treponema sp.]